MKKGLIPGLSFAAALAFTAAPAIAAEMDAVTPEVRTDTAAVSDVEGVPTDAPVVIFRTREEHEKALARQALARPANSPLMTFHGGTILPTSATKAIFWGTNWGSPSFAGDKVTGLDSFYAGFGGSFYAGTSTEYAGTNGQVTVSSAYGGHLTDFSAGPRRAPKTSAVLAEVCKMVPSPDPSGHGYYAVYTDLPRGHAGYCAWHSWGSCNGTPVQFAFFFDLDGDPGCDPGVVGDRRFAGPRRSRERLGPRAVRGADRSARRGLVRLLGRRERRQVRLDVRQSIP